MAHQGLGWTNTILQLSPGSEFQSTSTGPRVIDDEDEGLFLGFTTYEACDLTAGTFYVKTLTGTSPYWKLELWPLYDDPPHGTYGYINFQSGSVLAETAAFQVTGSDYRHEQAFTAAYTATKNQKLGMLLKVDSGTCDGSNSVSVEYSSGKSDDMAFPWVSYTTNMSAGGGGPTWNDFQATTPNLTVVTDQDYDLAGPATIGNENQYTSFPSTDILDTEGDRVCNKLTIPSSDKPIEFVVGGFRHYGKGPESLKEIKIGVWNQAGSFLGGTALWDPDQQGQAGDSSDGFVNYYFDTNVTMESGETYYIGVERLTEDFPIGRQIVSEITDTAQEATALKAFRSWPLGADCRMFIWDAADGSPAWKLHEGVGYTDAFPYSRMLIDPIIHDIHGSGEGGGSSIPGPSIGVIG